MFKNLFKGFRKKEEEKETAAIKKEESEQINDLKENIKEKEDKQEKKDKTAEIEKQIEIEKEPEEKEVIKKEIIKKEEKEKGNTENLEIKKEEKKEDAQEKKKGVFAFLKEKLKKSREEFFGKIKNLFSGRSVIDDEMYEELEDLLIQSDIGYDMTLKIVENLEKKVKEKKVEDPSKVYEVLKEVLSEFLIHKDNELKVNSKGLNVVLVVGVNGVGKTTTIGKVAAKLKREGRKIVIGAADTFRAAAIEQLEEWGKRAGVEVIKHTQGADPGAVVFDTLKAARSRNADIAIIDTAGRLHNKSHLMAELTKINKIIKKEIGEETFYESILVIDGTTGQNGLTQAKVFNEATALTGFVLTKMDGTSKGGIIFSISEELKKPVKYIGVGEGIDDLREFDSEEFINAIFE